MAILTLEAEQSSKLEPKKIVVKDNNGNKIANVYADSSTTFYGRFMQSAELDEIKVVKDNFFLFWNNLITKQ
jgi:hypothetical protein